MLPALVSLDDLTVRLGGIDAADEERAQATLLDASALVRSEAGDDFTDDDGNPDEDIPDVVLTVTMAVATRAFRNPEGARSETIGNYSVTWGDTSLGVYLTEYERRTLRRAAGKSSIGSVTLESPWQPSVRSVPVDIGGDAFPWVTIGDESL